MTLNCPVRNDCVNYPDDRSWRHFGGVGGSTSVGSALDGVVDRSRLERAYSSMLILVRVVVQLWMNVPLLKE